MYMEIRIDIYIYLIFIVTFCSLIQSSSLGKILIGRLCVVSFRSHTVTCHTSLCHPLARGRVIHFSMLRFMCMCMCMYGSVIQRVVFCLCSNGITMVRMSGRMEVVCRGMLKPRKFMQRRRKLEVFKDPADEAHQKNWRRIMTEIDESGSAVSVLSSEKINNQGVPKALIVGTLIRFKQLKKWNLVVEVYSSTFLLVLVVHESNFFITRFFRFLNGFGLKTGGILVRWIISCLSRHMGSWETSMVPRRSWL